MNKIKDFPIADEYPYVDAVIDDVEGKALCYPKYGDKCKVVVKCDDNKFSGKVTTVTTDRKEFIKLYRDGIKVMLGLSYTAQRVMAYIMDVMKPKSQYVEIITSTCMQVCGFKTPKSVRDGILELLSKDVITRNPYSMRYWVNPLLMFNGNRVEFVNEFIYKEV